MATQSNISMVTPFMVKTALKPCELFEISIQISLFLLRFICLFCDVMIESWSVKLIKSRLDDI